MNSIKSLITLGLLTVSVTFANAFNSLTITRNIEADNVETLPISKPSYLEKNINAKFIAKQLNKLVSSGTSILGNPSDVLERYGYHTSSDGTFFNNFETTLANSSNQLNTIVSVKHSEEGDIIRIKVASNKDLLLHLSTQLGTEIPFGLINLGDSEIFILPSHILPKGNYIIRLNTKTGEESLKLQVKQTRLLGKK